MACRICGRSTCTESFHSIEEQERFREQFGNFIDKIKELKDKVRNLEKAYDILYDYLDKEQQKEAEKSLAKLSIV